MKIRKKICLTMPILVLSLVIGLKYSVFADVEDVNYHNTKDNIMAINVKSFNRRALNSKNKSIPVLMYHYIRDIKGSSLATSKEKFARQMKYIHDEGYTAITLGELYDYNSGKITLPNKSVVITFDDGYKDNYENAYPILKKYKLNATIFVITDFINKNEDIVTSKEIKEMSDNGIDIESHTTHHDDLKGLSYEQQLKTMVDSRKVLEKIINKPVKYVAYPNGSYNDNSIKACRNAGYVMAFRTHENWCNKKDGMYSLNRIYMNGNLTMVNFLKRINNSNYHLMVWRVWEHVTGMIDS